MDTPGATLGEEDRQHRILRWVAGLSAALILGGLLWITVGPTASTETRQCTVTEAPAISHGRRSLYHSVETSCGKFAIRPEDYFTARTGLEVGKRYGFTLEKRPLATTIVEFTES